MGYAVPAPIIIRATLALQEQNFEVGGTLFHAGVTIAFLFQNLGLFFTIMVAHPINVQGPKRMWASLTEKSGNSGQSNQTTSAQTNGMGSNPPIDSA